MNAKRGLWLVLIVVALLLGACAPLGAGSASVADRETISVLGVGRAKGDPDVATISVGVAVVNEAIAEAVAESNQTMDDITQALLGMGIAEADIQSTNFSIWQEEIWDPETGQPTDGKRFHVDSTLQIILREVERVGEVLEISIENGANSIYGLSFGIDDTSDLASEARAAAIADARSRAEEIAAELGVELGEVLSISDQSGQPYPMFEAAYGYGIGGGGGEPPISEGAMSINVSVSVSYAINR